jgi:GAF domain-containing protein
VVSDISDRKRAEVERELLLTETRARAEREALLNRIGEAVRAPMNPDDVLRAAVKALGRALHASRCYFVTYDQGRDSGKVGPDWYREGTGLSSIAAEYRMSDYAVNRDVGYLRGSTQIVEDVHDHMAPSPAADHTAPPVSLMDALGLRSLIRVPLVSDGLITALVVAMSDAPRRWTEDEVRLVETVAAQTRAAVESARVQQRERNIAQTLQAALQPPPPDDLRGWHWRLTTAPRWRKRCRRGQL